MRNIYLYNIEGYSKYKRPDYWNSLTTITAPCYILDGFLSFSPCGTMFPSFLLISGHVELRDALDRSTWIIARRCGGLDVHRITDQAHALIYF